MSIEYWMVTAGALLLTMALGSTLLGRLPLTTAIIYLAVGALLGPLAFGVLDIDPIARSMLLHRLSEAAVVISLFTAGLKLRIEWNDRRWLPPLRLAFLAMVATIGLIALAGMIGLGLSAGAAILLGAILAPSNPDLASDIEVGDPDDQDRLRLALTGEAGFNDGAAFPFIMLGLGLLGLHDLGSSGWRWVAIDLVWAVAGGLAIGALLGMAVGRLVVYLRGKHDEAVSLGEFLTLGLMALSYGGALVLHTYGFLAVFAAGLALRRVEFHDTEGEFGEAVEEMHQRGEDTATNPDTAAVHLAEELLGFNEQLAQIAELALVLVIGSLLASHIFTVDLVWFLPLMLLVIRPVAAAVGLVGSRTAPTERILVSWFGIKGIASLYYLMYAIDHGLPETTARQLLPIVLVTVAVSIVVHGITVTPVMRWYEARGKRSGTRAG